MSGLVKDVQINGTTAVVDGVANIPYATNAVFGLAKGNPTCGIKFDKGLASTAPASESIIGGNRRSTASDCFYRPITSYCLDYAVKAAMCDGKGKAWTDAEQTAARTRMGAVSSTDVSTAITEALSAIGVAEEGSY